jgi:hypothetical protein
MRDKIERTDAPLDEGVTRRIANFWQDIFFGCTVIHGIDIDDVTIRVLVIIMVDKMGADETAPTGYEKTFFES